MIVLHSRPALKLTGKTRCSMSDTTCGTGNDKCAILPQSWITGTGLHMRTAEPTVDVAPSTSSRMPMFQHPVCHNALLSQIRKDASVVGSRTRRVRLLLQTKMQKSSEQFDEIRRAGVIGMLRLRTRCSTRLPASRLSLCTSGVMPWRRKKSCMSTVVRSRTSDSSATRTPWLSTAAVNAMEDKENSRRRTLQASLISRTLTFYHLTCGV